MMSVLFIPISAQETKTIKIFRAFNIQLTILTSFNIAILGYLKLSQSILGNIYWVSVRVQVEAWIGTFCYIWLLVSSNIHQKASIGI